MNSEIYEDIFPMIEEGVALRMSPRRFAVQKLHNGILRAARYYDFTPQEILTLAPAIGARVDITSSNTIGDSAFDFLEGVRHRQGHYSPQERYERPVPESIEWTIDRDMIYHTFAPWMVERHFSYKDPRLCRAIADWMSMSTTQDLIDIGTGIADADDRRRVDGYLWLWRLAGRSEFGYKWHRVLPYVVNKLRAWDCWEGRDEPEFKRAKKTRAEKNPTGSRAAGAC